MADHDIETDLDIFKIINHFTYKARLATKRLPSPESFNRLYNSNIFFLYNHLIILFRYMHWLFAFILLKGEVSY